MTEEPVRSLSCSSEHLVSCGPCNATVWDFQSMSEAHIISMSAMGMPTGMPTFVNASIVTFDDDVQGPQCRVLTGDASGTFKVWTMSDNSAAKDGKSVVSQVFQAKPSLGTMLEFATSPSTSGGRSWPDILLSGTGRETELFVAKKVAKPHITMQLAVHLHSSNSIVAVENKDLVVWDIMSGAETSRVKDASSVEITAISLDSPLQRKLYVGNSKGDVSIFNAFSCSQISVVSAHDAAVLAISFCEVSHHVITCAVDRTVKVFKEEAETSGFTLKELRTLTQSHSAESSMSCFDYSPALSLFVTVSGEEMKVWNFQDLHLQDRLDLHATEVTAVTFVPKMPVFVSGDIQGRVLVWSVEMRTTMSAASFKCMLSCHASSASPTVGISSPSSFTPSPPGSLVNVRHLKLLYDPADKEKEGAPSALVCSDFTGRICTWDFNEALAAMGAAMSSNAAAAVVEVMKPSEYASADETYNANLRYTKNGRFSAAKGNRSQWPPSSMSMPSSSDWQGHDESILSLECIQASPMILTTAADCKLRLWAAVPCKLGLRDCTEGTLFGEIDTMDYEEQREERAERWHCPNVLNVSEMEEHSHIAKEVIEELEEEGEGEIRSMEDLKRINPALLRGGEGGMPPSMGGGGLQGRGAASLGGSKGSGGGAGSPQLSASVSMGNDGGRSRGKKKATLATTQQHSVTRRLKELASTNAPKPVRNKKSMKRVSMVIAAVENESIETELAAGMRGVGGKDDAQELERAKQMNAKKVVDSMRQSMTSAYTSKTMTGKVIYDNLYTETKMRDKSGGAELPVTDLTVSDFVKDKFEEEKRRKKKARKAFSKKKQQAAGRVAREREEYLSRVREWEKEQRGEKEEGEGEEVEEVEEEVTGGDTVGDMVGDLNHDGEATRIENLSSFFVTEVKPETPKFLYDVGPGTEYGTGGGQSTVGSLQSEESLGSLRTVLTDAESMDRILERRQSVTEKIYRENNLVKFQKAQKLQRLSNLKSGASRGERRMSLMARQTEISKNTESKLSDEKIKALTSFKRQSIANSRHFGTYTRSEVLQLADLLFAMDLNNDRRISTIEFEHYVKNGDYCETFKHLQFEVMDIDHSGEITVEEVVSLAFRKAPAEDRRRIMICIDDDLQKRAELRSKLALRPANNYKRISADEMREAGELFEYFDVEGKGRITLKELNKVLAANNTLSHVLGAEDVKGMLREYGEREGTSGDVVIDLEAFVNFTYAFKGGFEVVDSRNGEVLERHKLPAI